MSKRVRRVGVKGDDENARRTTLGLRLSKKERKELEARAVASGAVNVNEYVRTVLFGISKQELFKGGEE